MARPLVRARIAAADFVRNRFAVSPEAGTTIDEVMLPEYTANITDTLKRWDIIEVRPDDETYYAELLVKTAERTGATFWLVHFVELAGKAQDAKDDDQFVVGWGGPHQKHRVLRKTDNTVLQSGFSSSAEARAWAETHTKAMTA